MSGLGASTSRTPLVTVLLPVRNGERFVGESIASILEQSIADLTLMVLDDGSTDGTVEIVRRLAAQDSRVALETGRGIGLAATLNRGLAAAAAPYLARMDADDVAVDVRLERQLDVLESDAEIAVVGSAMALVDESGRQFGSVRQPATREEVAAELERRSCVSHPSVVCRTAAIRELGGYRTPFLHAEDYDLWLRVAERHAIVNLDDELVRYRLHDAQVTVGHLEQQVAAAVAARRLASRRRSGLAEGPLPDVADARFVAELGVSSDELAREFAAAAAHWASLLADAGRDAAAFATLDGARLHLDAAGETGARALLDRTDARLAARSGRVLRAARLAASVVRCRLETQAAARRRSKATSDRR